MKCTLLHRTSPPPARHPLGCRGGTARHRPRPDERHAAAESRGTHSLHHRPAETNQRTETTKLKEFENQDNYSNPFAVYYLQRMQKTRMQRALVDRIQCCRGCLV